MCKISLGPEKSPGKESLLCAHVTGGHRCIWFPSPACCHESEDKSPECPRHGDEGCYFHVLAACIPGPGVGAFTCIPPMDPDQPTVTQVLPIFLILLGELGI